MKTKTYHGSLNRRLKFPSIRITLSLLALSLGFHGINTLLNSDSIFASWSGPDLTITKNTVNDEDGEFSFKIKFQGESWEQVSTSCEIRDSDSTIETYIKPGETLSPLKPIALLGASASNDTINFSKKLDNTNCSYEGTFRFTFTLPAGLSVPADGNTYVKVDGTTYYFDELSDYSVDGNTYSFMMTLQSEYRSVEVGTKIDSATTYEGDASLKIERKISDAKDLDLTKYGLTPTNEAGVYTFSLRNGESKNLEDLPTGIQYEITEIEQSGWTLKEETNTNGTLTDDITATFLNEKSDDDTPPDDTPPTDTPTTEETPPTTEETTPASDQPVVPADTKKEVVKTGIATSAAPFYLIIFVLGLGIIIMTTTRTVVFIYRQKNNGGPCRA